MKPAIIFDTPADFKKFVGNKDFKVTFRKANGQFRAAEANCAKVVSKGLLDEGVKESRSDAGQVSFVDLKKQAVRSFVLKRITRLEIDGQVYQFGL